MHRAQQARYTSLVSYWAQDRKYFYLSSRVACAAQYQLQSRVFLLSSNAFLSGYCKLSNHSGHTSKARGYTHSFLDVVWRITGWRHPTLSTLRIWTRHAWSSDHCPLLSDFSCLRCGWTFYPRCSVLRCRLLLMRGVMSLIISMQQGCSQSAGSMHWLYHCLTKRRLPSCPTLALSLHYLLFKLFEQLAHNQLSV